MEDGVARRTHRASFLNGKYRGKEILNVLKRAERRSKKLEKFEDAKEETTEAKATEEVKTTEEVASVK